MQSLLSIIFLFSVCGVFSQSIENVDFRAEGKTIVVTYDFFHSKADTAINVELVFKEQKGGVVTPKTISGNLKNVKPGESKRIVWDVLSDGINLSGKYEAEVSIQKNTPVINLKSVLIGEQSWTSENLNVDRFRNGDLIPEAKTAEEWINAGKNKQAAWCYYNNDPNNEAKYGKLYNWHAVNDTRGLAPTGWHVPTEAEWTILSDFLGGENQAGTKMKSTSGWSASGDVTNLSINSSIRMDMEWLSSTASTADFQIRLTNTGTTPVKLNALIIRGVHSPSITTGTITWKALNNNTLPGWLNWPNTGTANLPYISSQRKLNFSSSTGIFTSATAQAIPSGSGVVMGTFRMSTTTNWAPNSNFGFVWEMTSGGVVGYVNGASTVSNIQPFGTTSTATICASCLSVTASSAQPLNPMSAPTAVLSGDATISIGFAGLPGGCRRSSGYFYDVGFIGDWWSASENSESSAWYRGLYSSYSDLNRNDYYKSDGFSVRCVRD